MTYQSRVARGGGEPASVGKYIKFVGHLEKDPWQALDELGTRPLFWYDDPEDVDGYWVATSFNDVRDILQDAETFSSEDSLIPYVPTDTPLLPTEADPPYLLKMRKIIVPLLTAKRLDAHIRHITKVCSEIIGKVAKNGGCDVVDEVARVFPVTIFLELFGLSADKRGHFRDLANTFLHSVDKKAWAWNEIRAILREELEKKRETPADDLLTAVAFGQIDDMPLDEEVAVSLAATLFVGGLDTLPSNMSWTIRFLAENPSYRQQLLDRPELIPNAVEEFLRLFSVANPMRRVTRDLDFRGANLKAGDRILTSIAAANRDQSVFGSQVSFEREVNPSLTFATGPHRCLGSHLARVELKIFLELWHQMIPNYRIKPGSVLTFSGPVLGLEALPVEWNV